MVHITDWSRGLAAWEASAVSSNELSDQVEKEDKFYTKYVIVMMGGMERSIKRWKLIAVMPAVLLERIWLGIWSHVDIVKALVVMKHTFLQNLFISLQQSKCQQRTFRSMEKILKRSSEDVCRSRLASRLSMREKGSVGQIDSLSRGEKTSAATRLLLQFPSQLETSHGLARRNHREEEIS